MGRWPVIAALGLSASLGCAPDQSAAREDEIRQPTGLTVSRNGRWLFVTNGNWDRGRTESSLVVVDIARFEDARMDPHPAGRKTTAAQPCRERPEGSDTIECDVRRFVREDLTVRLPSGAGNIAVDRGLEDEGVIRLLVPTRLETGLWWIDVSGLGSNAPRLDCGQREDRFCDDTHGVADVRPEPSRIVVDEQGFPYAYMPHLLDRRFSLVRLRGERGPEIADVEEEFYRLDPLFDSGLGGGFSVAQRPCSVADGDAPTSTLDCRRPLLYSTHRFWFGVRTFRIAPGLDVVLPGGDFSVPGAAVEAGAPRPLMGDLRFIDPDDGSRLLVVHTTPPAISLIDTSLDDEGEPRNELLRSLPLCGNPNLLEMYRPDDAPWLAFVSCYGQDRVEVIDVESFEVVRSISLGHGTNEMAVDHDGARLYVANTRESTISVVELERTSPQYLREVAILGLGGRERVP